MTGRRRRPRRWRWLVGSSTLLALVASACGGGSSGGSGTTVTYVGVAGGAISFGMTQSPTGCNPNTPDGDTPGTQTVLAGVLPSPFVVNAAGSPTANASLIVSSELVDTKPETIVYTLNPKAVWSDGVPITADDFKYAWQQQRGDPSGAAAADVASIAGYRDIASVTGSNDGHTVTVKFKTTFADWQMLFANLLPAHIMEKVGWNPACSTVDPAVDLSGGPFMLGAVTPQAITLVQNPRWWGTPANSKSITVHIASSTAQLGQWIPAQSMISLALPRFVWKISSGFTWTALTGRWQCWPRSWRHGSKASSVPTRWRSIFTNGHKCPMMPASSWCATARATGKRSRHRARI